MENQKRLRCPQCLSNKLWLSDQNVTCKQCKIEFAIQDNIPLLFYNYSFPIVLIGGYSGIGKTYLINKILSLHKKFKRPISYTTRRKRINEESDEYVFVSTDEFEGLIYNESLINTDYVYGNYYGVTYSSIIENHLNGFLSIKEIHPENFHEFNKKNIKSISVLINGEQESFLNEERRERDLNYYKDLKPSDFDLVFDKKEINNIDFIVSEIVKKVEQISVESEIDTINYRGYNSIASEFYDSKRITTANFHQLSEEFFIGTLSKIKIDSDILDLGCGTGFITSIIRDKGYHENLIACDLSVSMLRELKGNYQNINVVCCSAFNTPFQKNSFDIIFSSLCDAFCTQELFYELKRILKKGGEFIFSIPSDIWSNGLRDSDKHMTNFTLSNLSSVQVHSFTYSMSQLTYMAENAGLRVIQSKTMFGDYLISNKFKISPALTNSATKLNIDFGDLPIINLFQIRKEHE